jgi:hypothetical protein
VQQISIIFYPVDVHLTTNMSGMFSDTKETETDALWWWGNASKLEVSKRPDCPTDPILPYSTKVLLRFLIQYYFEELLTV